MFSRRERLLKTAFPSRGRRFSSEHFSVVVPDDTRGYAVVVSKKIARLSVTRHRLKRRVTGTLERLPLPPALIVYPRAGAAALTAAELRDELGRLVAELSRYRKIPT